MDRSQNFFSTNCMEAFDLFNVPINTFCNNVDRSSTNTEKLKREPKANFPKFFSKGLGFCSNVKAKFELEEDATSIFWPKKQVVFAAMANIGKELERLKKLRVIEKNDYSP